MNIFDIHAHIYPDHIADRATQGISDAYDGFPVPNRGTAEMLSARAREAGVTQTCVCSVATRPGQTHSINRFILDACEREPSFVPVAAVHPDSETLEEDIDAIVGSGFAAVKVHPEMQGFLVNERRAVRMFDMLAGRLPVLIHCGDHRRDDSSPERIRDMLSQVPGLTLICAHFGGWMDWERSATVLRDERVFTDCSSSFYALSDETITRVIRMYGSERVLYGTDYPMFTQKTEVERLLTLPLTDREKEDILWNSHLNVPGLNTGREVHTV